jgi:hypothetical protein
MFNLKKEFSYFKKLIWIFVLLLIIFNIWIFYFLNSFYYLIALIAWNIVLIWFLIPIFIWIWKTYLIDRTMEMVDDLKSSWKEKIVKVIKK